MHIVQGIHDLGTIDRSVGDVTFPFVDHVFPHYIHQTIAISEAECVTNQLPISSRLRRLRHSYHKLSVRPTVVLYFLA